jgi:hypothetical protein
MTEAAQSSSQTHIRPHEIQFQFASSKRTNQQMQKSSIITFQVLRRQQHSTDMVILNQRPDLTRDLGPLPTHHEALSHRPTSTHNQSAHSLTSSIASFTMFQNKPEAKAKGKRQKTYQSRSSHFPSSPSSGTASIFSRGPVLPAIGSNRIASLLLPLLPPSLLPSHKRQIAVGSFVGGGGPRGGVQLARKQER